MTSQILSYLFVSFAGVVQYLGLGFFIASCGAVILTLQGKYVSLWGFMFDILLWPLVTLLGVLIIFKRLRYAT